MNKLFTIILIIGMVFCFSNAFAKHDCPDVGDGNGHHDHGNGKGKGHDGDDDGGNPDTPANGGDIHSDNTNVDINNSDPTGTPLVSGDPKCTLVEWWQNGFSCPE